MNSNLLLRMNAYFFDLDGCLYFGDQPADRAEVLLRLLREKGKKVRFVTNNSRQTANEIADRLTQMGISALPEEVLSATDYIGKFIRDKYGRVSVKAAGSESLEMALNDAGHQVIPLLNQQSQADVIVIGRDTEFTYEKLALIAEEEGKGARIISANPDRSHPGRNGVRVPETGSLVAAIEAVIGQNVEFFGKPAPYLFRYGMEMCAESPEHCVMIGDNLHTDIQGGIAAGMSTVWVRGEAELPQQLDPTPDVIIEKVGEIVDYF